VCTARLRHAWEQWQVARALTQSRKRLRNPRVCTPLRSGARPHPEAAAGAVQGHAHAPAAAGRLRVACAGGRPRARAPRQRAVLRAHARAAARARALHGQLARLARLRSGW